MALEFQSRTLIWLRSKHAVSREQERRRMLRAPGPPHGPRVLASPATEERQSQRFPRSGVPTSTSPEGATPRDFAASPSPPSLSLTRRSAFLPDHRLGEGHRLLKLEVGLIRLYRIELRKTLRRLVRKLFRDGRKVAARWKGL